MPSRCNITKVSRPIRWPGARLKLLSSGNPSRQYKNGYQDALFTSPDVAREVAAPLVDYIRSQLVDQDKANAPKVTVMVGHDSNIASLLSALQVKPYELPGNDEKTPIGGQVVFERWHDAKTTKIC